jgi:hypothetical protein
MRFQILSISGTLTRASAVYRVTSFRRYGNGVRRVHVGDVGKLLLKDGIMTNTLTRDFFCSDPSWGGYGSLRGLGASTGSVPSAHASEISDCTRTSKPRPGGVRPRTR